MFRLALNGCFGWGPHGTSADLKMDTAAQGHCPYTSSQGTHVPTSCTKEGTALLDAFFSCLLLYMSS